MGVHPIRAWLPAALAIVGGCALIAATFMAWYAGADIEGAYFNRAIGAPAYAGVFSSWGDSGRNAYDAFTALDVALVAFAGLAVVAGLGAVGVLPPRLRRAVSVATGVAGLGVGGWVLERIFDRPQLVGLGPGAVIGFAAIVVAVIGAWLSIAAGPATPGPRAP